MLKRPRASLTDRGKSRLMLPGAAPPFRAARMRVSSPQVAAIGSGSNSIGADFAALPTWVVVSTRATSPSRRLLLSRPAFKMMPTSLRDLPCSPRSLAIWKKASSFTGTGSCRRRLEAARRCAWGVELLPGPPGTRSGLRAGVEARDALEDRGGGCPGRTGLAATLLGWEHAPGSRGRCRARPELDSGVAELRPGLVEARSPGRLPAVSDWLRRGGTRCLTAPAGRAEPRAARSRSADRRVPAASVGLAAGVHVPGGGEQTGCRGRHRGWRWEACPGRTLKPGPDPAALSVAAVRPVRLQPGVVHLEDPVEHAGDLETCPARPGDSTS